MAVGFGLASVCSVIVLGDESGYEVGQVQKVKLATMEAAWETEPPPASFTLFGFPDQEAQKTRGDITVPWLGGLIVTRSLDKPIKGVKELVAESEARIEKGMRAFGLLQTLRAGHASPDLLQEFNGLKQHLGYGLLLKRYTPRVVDATPEQVRRAALGTIPNVGVMFWSFRIMVGLGFYGCVRLDTQVRAIKVGFDVPATDFEHGFLATKVARGDASGEFARFAGRERGARLGAARAPPSRRASA